MVGQGGAGKTTGGMGPGYWSTSVALLWVLVCYVKSPIGVTHPGQCTAVTALDGDKTWIWAYKTQSVTTIKIVIGTTALFNPTDKWSWKI